jgi:serine/threonine protein kinase
MLRTPDRDLKPSNIGFTYSGEVKLFDFGLAREVRDPSRRLTGYTGSARYMSPEGKSNLALKRVLWLPNYLLAMDCRY